MPTWIVAGWREVRGAGIRTAGFRLAAARPRAVRTDCAPPAWHCAVMTSTRKRKALDLFVEAVLHPVRFR
jgi:hypothetical protein